MVRARARESHGASSLVVVVTWHERTVNKKKSTKCRPLSLCPYVGIFDVDKPRYADVQSRPEKAATGRASVSCRFQCRQERRVSGGIVDKHTQERLADSKTTGHYCCGIVLLCCEEELAK